GANSPFTTLVLNKQNALTGASSVNLAPGNLTLLQTQDYSGGTSINSTIAGGNSNVGVGSDAAFGSGTITLSTAANTISFGSVNGDRVIPNQILNQQPAANAFVAGADYTNDGISNNSAQGATTYTGTLDLNARTGVALLYSRTNHAALFLGNISNGTGGLTLTSSTAGLFGLLTNGGASKGFSGTVTLSDGSNLYIDANGSLGTGTSGVTLGNSTLALQPGTGTVTLSSRAITITSDKSPLFMVYEGGNLVSTSGISSANSMTAARTLTKNGAGTLTLQGKNGTWASTASWSNTIQIQGGKLVLDATAGTFTAASDRFLADTNAFPLTFGAASATLGGGGTLEMVQYSGNANALTQAFAGTLTVNQGAHTLKITNNDASAAANLNLGSTFTRTTLNGGTMNFVSASSGGTNTFGSGNTGTNGIIGGWATFNGVDWATGSGTAITALGSYTTLPTSGSTATVNYNLATNATTTLTGSQSINSLKLAPTGASQVLALGANILTNTSGGIIFDNSSGATTISGTGQIGA
ncbi:MAG: hypothetical protein EBQ59_00695, partial [Verrucomicrobia bacterium]|nr:hypothetical protein [Verrucomicrobiota bacterium]